MEKSVRNLEILTDLVKEDVNGFEDVNDDEILRHVRHVIESEFILESPGKPIYISIVLTNNSVIKELNAAYRGKDYATDVLSFAFNDTEEIISDFYMLGEIYISLEKVKSQSEEYENSFRNNFV